MLHVRAVSPASLRPEVVSRLVSARGVRLAVKRVLADRELRSNARSLGDWAARHDGASVAADALEEFATRPRERGAATSR